MKQESDPRRETAYDATQNCILNKHEKNAYYSYLPVSFNRTGKLSEVLAASYDPHNIIEKKKKTNSKEKALLDTVQ